MCSADKIKVVLLQELHNDLFAETVTDSALVRFPVGFHICRIRPEEIVEQSVVRNVGGAGDVANVVHVAERRTKTAVDAEDLPSYNRGNGQGVERIHKGLPNLDVAPSLTLVVEAVDACDVGTLVVPAQEEEVLGVADLVAEEQENCLQTLFAAVDVVTKEEEVAVGWEAAHLKHADQVGVLAVHVTDDFHGRRQFKQCWLRQEDFASSVADSSDFCILEADGLCDLAGVSSIHKTLDHIVDVGILERSDFGVVRRGGGLVKLVDEGECGSGALSRCSSSLFRFFQNRRSRVFAMSVMCAAAWWCVGHRINFSTALCLGDVAVRVLDRCRGCGGRRRVRRVGVLDAFFACVRLKHGVSLRSAAGGRLYTLCIRSLVCGSISKS